MAYFRARPSRISQGPGFYLLPKEFPLQRQGLESCRRHHLAFFSKALRCASALSGAFCIPLVPQLFPRSPSHFVMHYTVVCGVCKYCEITMPVHGGKQRHRRDERSPCPGRISHLQLVSSKKQMVQPRWLVLLH